MEVLQSRGVHGCRGVDEEGEEDEEAEEDEEGDLINLIMHELIFLKITDRNFHEICSNVLGL
jgi:hypothetical protein